MGTRPIDSKHSGEKGSTSSSSESSTAKFFKFAEVNENKSSGSEYVFIKTPTRRAGNTVNNTSTTTVGNAKALVFSELVTTIENTQPVKVEAVISHDESNAVKSNTFGISTESTSNNNERITASSNTDVEDAESDAENHVLNSESKSDGFEINISNFEVDADSAESEAEAESEEDMGNRRRPMCCAIQ